MVCVSHLTRFVLCTFLPHIFAQQKVHDPTIGPCMVPPLRMPSTKELDINPCCSSWIIGSVSSWILMFVANLHVTKTFENFNIWNYVLPPTFNRKNVSDPLRVLDIFSSLHVVWGCFPAILNHGCPAFPNSEAQNYPNKTTCYVQRPWWLWEKMNPVRGWWVLAKTTGSQVRSWFIKFIRWFWRQRFFWYLYTANGSQNCYTASWFHIGSPFWNV